MMKKSLVFASILSLTSLLVAQENELIKPITDPVAQQELIAPAPTPKHEHAKPAKKAKKVKMNVAIVDLQKIIGETQFDRAGRAEFEALQQKLQKELEEIGRELQTEGKQFEAQASTLTPEAKEKKQRDLAEKNQKAQTQLQDANQQLQKKEFAIRSNLTQQIRSYAQQLIDHDGTISMVIDSSVVLAHAKGVDATDKLATIIKTDMAKKEAAKKAAHKQEAQQKQTPQTK